jgi:hypothetical protein
LNINAIDVGTGEHEFRMHPGSMTIDVGTVVVHNKNLGITIIII